MCVLFVLVCVYDSVLCACVCVCMHVCVNVCMCVHVCVCMYVCVHVRCWRVSSLGVGSGVWGAGRLYVLNVKRFYDMVCRIGRVCWWRWCMGVGGWM